MADQNNSIEHGLHAARANAADSRQQEQVDELASQLNNSMSQADGMRYDYDDASDLSE